MTRPDGQPACPGCGSTSGCSCAADAEREALDKLSRDTPR